MIRALLAHRPDELVAIGEAGDRTAAELLADSGRVATFLLHRGAGELLLICQDRYRFAAGLLGAWRARKAVLLPPNGQPETIASLARSPRVCAFLHDRPGAPEGRDIDSLSEVPQPGPLQPLPADRHVATLATSGSTGAHQLSPKTAAQLLGEAFGLVEQFAVPWGARVVATVPPHHIYGVLFSVLLPLRARGAFLRETPFHAETVLAALDSHRATHLVSVPAHLRALGQGDPVSSLARVFSSGAALPADTAHAVTKRLRLPVTDVYGSSETGGIAWREAPEADWQPFRDVKVAAAEGGQLLLDSPLLAPDVERPAPCDDRIALADGGRFRLLGRMDRVAKVGGRRVSLAEIEDRTLGLPGVLEAAALMVEVGGARGEEIWLAAVAPGWEPASLRRALSRWFDPATVPKRIRMPAALPREENGKLVRRRLRELFEVPSAEVTELTPETETSGSDALGNELRTFEVLVPPDLLFFQGHFPGHPVLPGVVQLDRLVLRQAARAWPDLGSARRLQQLKFRRVVSPGERLTLRLVREGPERVSFEIAAGQASCATGRFCFGRARR